MEKKIIINRSAVMDKVSAESVYLAGRAQGTDEQTFDRLYVTDEDKQLLDSYYNDAVSALVSAINEYVSDLSDINASSALRDDTTLTLNLPAHAGVGISTLASDITNYIVSAVLADYLARLADERSSLYSDSATALLQSVNDKLNSRSRLTHAEICTKRGEVCND